MALKEFTSSSKWWDGMWGGGHTVGTDPTQHGWKACLSKPDSHVLVVGIPGKAGCFSVVQLSDQKADVAVYDSLTPSDLVKLLSTGTAYADGYITIDLTPGWFLGIVGKLDTDT